MLVYTISVPNQSCITVRYYSEALKSCNRKNSYTGASSNIVVQRIRQKILALSGGGKLGSFPGTLVNVSSVEEWNRFVT